MEPNPEHLKYDLRKAIPRTSSTALARGTACTRADNNNDDDLNDDDAADDADDYGDDDYDDDDDDSRSDDPQCYCGCGCSEFSTAPCDDDDP